MNECCDCKAEKNVERIKQDIYFDLEHRIDQRLDACYDLKKNSNLSACEFIKVEGLIEGYNAVHEMIDNLINCSIKAEQCAKSQTKEGIKNHIENLEEDLCHSKAKLLEFDIKTEAKTKGK